MRGRLLSVEPSVKLYEAPGLGNLSSIIMQTFLSTHLTLLELRFLNVYGRKQNSI